jgi:nucleoside-diphosphate-sugar epimerase
LPTDYAKRKETMTTQNNKPILITGGSGFIASYLAMYLAEERKENVVLFDRDPDLRRMTGFGARYESIKHRITFVQGDLIVLEHVMALFDKHEPKAVYHLGALLSAGAESNPTMGFEVDLVGTRNVFEAARIYCQNRNQDPVKVIFPSTIASFGSFIEPGALVPNEAPQLPLTMYGVAKVSVERLGEYYTRKNWLDFRAVRFPSVIGAARGPGGTTVYSTLLVQNPALGMPYKAYVQDQTRLDILYVKDAVKAITQLHDAPANKLKRRVYNIAGIRIDGKAPTAKDIQNSVEKVIGKDGAITYDPNPVLQEAVNSFGVLNDEAARKDWDWKGLDFDTLDNVVKDFNNQVKEYPNRIKSLELFGA